MLSNGDEIRMDGIEKACKAMEFIEFTLVKSECDLEIDIDKEYLSKEWKDVLPHKCTLKIRNSHLVSLLYTVHSTHSTEASASTRSDQSHFNKKSSNNRDKL